ncbi:MAG TPA: 23S rRNA methyltransferase [Mariprofundaceae bacterium]|nr:23S rRNA methyltransferase [Mariprofundaceae bacterium]
MTGLLVESGVAERLLPGGEATVRTPSGICLVPNAVPGDRLDIQIEDRRRGACRGRVQYLKTPSGERIAEPACPVACACGGCALQFVRREYQAQTKNGWVSDALAPHLSARTNFRGITAADVVAGSRRRIRWWQGGDGQDAYWGLHGRASHDVVRHDDCMAVTPNIRLLHGHLAAMSLPGVESVQVTELADGMHMVLEGEGRDAHPAVPAVIADLPVQGWFRSGTKVTPLSRPAHRMHDRLPAGDGWIDLAVGPEDFIQASRAGNEAMIRQVQAWSSGAGRVADMFSGFGNLSLPLAAAIGSTVIGAEVRAASVMAANHSARDLGLDARYVQADLFGNFDLSPFAGMDVLILDPPRKGARRICKALPILLPRQIILISCDIASGARDAEMIARQGYRLEAVRVLDMFPYAGHVEAMSLWRL